MSTSRHSPEGFLKDPQGIDGRTAPLGSPTQSKTGKDSLRRSTRLGFLFYLQHLQELSEGQLRFLRKEQGTLKLSELQRAIHLYEALSASRRAQARAKKALEKLKQDCPSLQSKSIRREQRRIGVGYRDKGSLRQPHEDHTVSPRMWWSEDIAPALIQPPGEPRWITAEEVFGPERYEYLQELALRQILRSPWPDLYCQKSEGL